MIYAQPNAVFEATFYGFPSGLVGVCGVRIKDGNATVQARTVAGIVESIDTPGVYTCTLAAPAAGGQYAVIFDNGTAPLTPADIAEEDLTVNLAGAPVLAVAAGVKVEPFDVGDTVTISIPFTDAAGLPADPTTVTIKVKDPAGTVITRTSQAAQLAHPQLGTWELDYVIAAGMNGRHYVRAEGTGAVPLAVEGSFGVKDSAFD